MKRIATFALAALMLCVMVSCDQSPKEKIYPQPEKTKVLNYTTDIKGSSLSTKGENYKKEIQFEDDHSLVLKQWDKAVGQEDFDKEPDVVFTGRWSSTRYEKLVEETSSRIEKTSTPCITVTFSTLKVKDGTSQTVKEGYYETMRSYNGSFDVEYISGYWELDYPSLTENGGWYRTSQVGTTIAFQITQMEGKENDQSRLDREWMD